MKKIIKTGDLFHVNTIAELMTELFNTSLPYRASYFCPTKLHKYIPGGFYVWVEKFSEAGHIHDLGNGIVWKNVINESKTEIVKTFVGNRAYLTEDRMDMHGKKILVFLDKRPKQKTLEFLGVFGETGVLYSHNNFEGISYKMLKEEISYELPDPKPPKEKKAPTLKHLLIDRENTLSLMQILKDIPKGYDMCKHQLEEIEREIVERFGADALNKTDS